MRRRVLGAKAAVVPPHRLLPLRWRPARTPRPRSPGRSHRPGPRTARPRRRRSTKGRRPRTSQTASSSATRRRPASAHQNRGRRRARGRSSRHSRTGPRAGHSRTSRGTLARSPSVDRWLRSKGTGTRSPKERRLLRSSPTLVPMPGASADRSPELCRDRRSRPVLRRSPTPASTPARVPNPDRPPSPAPTSTLNLPLRVRRVLWQLRERTLGELGRRRDRATATPRLARGPVGLRTRPMLRPRLRGISRSFASRRNHSLRLSLEPPRRRLRLRPSATQCGTSLPFCPSATRGRRCAHLPRSGPGSGASRSALARVARAHRTGPPRAQRPQRTGPPRRP
jgi:hypothetical protein